MRLQGFPDHAQGRSAVLNVVAEDLALVLQAGDGVALFHRHLPSLWLRRRTWCCRRSLLIFGDVTGRVCTQDVAIRPERKSEDGKTDDDNGTDDRQIRARRFGPLTGWFYVGHGVCTLLVATSCGRQRDDRIIRSGERSARCPVVAATEGVTIAGHLLTWCWDLQAFFVCPPYNIRNRRSVRV